MAAAEIPPGELDALETACGLIEAIPRGDDRAMWLLLDGSVDPRRVAAYAASIAESFAADLAEWNSQRGQDVTTCEVLATVRAAWTEGGV